MAQLGHGPHAKKAHAGKGARWQFGKKDPVLLTNQEAVFALLQES